MFIPSLLLAILSFLSYPGNVLAITDPLSVPNNKVGIHILFPGELHRAATLVNRDGTASWGYVVIPIQAKDRDREKWQKFFDLCKENKIIPVIRVATVAEGPSWTSPNYFDLVDFANFLDDLRWPIQNRYIIFFNEVNRSDEYGGVISPENYADVLNNAIDIFKAKSLDFFILPAGLDNAASDRRNSVSWSDYLRRMFRKQPDIFNKIDGWTSHAYPNPDFSARPDKSGSNKIDSYKYDLQLIKGFTDKKLPVFITETGWSNRNLSDHQVALYYEYAFSKVWSDPQIVAIAPFLLDAQDGPFKQFSFLDTDNQPKEFAKTLSSFATNGSPAIPPAPTPIILPEVSVATAAPEVLGEQSDVKNIFQKLYNQFKVLINLLK